MAEAVRNGKILLQQLPKKGISSAVYNLKVPNIFTLAEYDHKASELYSPTFEFRNSTWCFRIYAESGAVGDNKKINVHLKRVKFKKKRENIFYEIEFLNGKDEVYKYTADYRRFSGYHEGELECLCKFLNEDLFHDERDVLTLTVHLICVESTERGLMADEYRLTQHEKAEKVRYDNIVISQLPRKGISSAVYTLNVPYVFTVAEYDNKTSVHFSPTFEFINLNWRLRIECRTDKKNKYLDISLERINFKKLTQRIFWEIELSDGDEVYNYHAGVKLLEDGENIGECSSFYLCHDKHNALFLTVHLIHVESTEMEVDQILMNRSALSLRDNLKGMLLNGQDHNLTFNVSGKNFRAHQDILRARSDVFRSMLTHDILEKKLDVIDVPDIDPEAFEQLLFYIYTGKVETFDESIMFGLYYAAVKYNLADLKEECCEFIKISLTNTNVCSALNLATKYSNEGLLNSATNYFFRNVEDILLTVEWKLFMEENSTVANELYIKSLKKIREAQSSDSK